MAEGLAAFPSNPGEYYWIGIGGTYIWVDPKADMFVTFMMQSPKQRVPYRSILRNIVYARSEMMLRWEPWFRPPFSDALGLAGGALLGHKGWVVRACSGPETYN